MVEKLKANIWKYFLLILFQRRNYNPILAIYFLTLPNTTAQQIGFFIGIGSLAGFLFEIPSGYLSDKLGHKKVLILSRIFMLLSTLFFAFGNSLTYFIIGSIFLSICFAFTSGTADAFLHNTLVGLKKEKQFAKINGKIKANIALISMVMILLLPFLTQISIVMPIKVYLIFDVLAIIVALSLYSPKIKYDAQDEEGEKIFSQLMRFKGTGFYVFSIFFGILFGVLTGATVFNTVYVESLGLPIILIGTIMALSRIIWYVVGHNLWLLKKMSFKTLMLFEIIFFSGLLILISQMINPFIAGALMALITGYRRGRDPIIQEYYLDNFLINKRYKATMLSIKSQLEQLINSGFTFIVGFIMGISFSLGYLVTGICLFTSLILIYLVILKVTKT